MNASSKVSNSQPLREEDEPVLEIWGGSSLSGQVQVSGAKNSALVLMAGTLLCSEECRLRNVPDLVDIDRMSQVLAALGVKMEKNGDTIDFDPRHVRQSQAPYEIVSQLRASFFVIGPLLARMGEAKVPLPGGCNIGSRPVALHLKGLQALGAEVLIESGIAHATVKGNGRLKGARVYLDYPSVGATETIMMAATLAEGETILENAAQEPEIVDLADFCRGMGAKITGDGTGTIVISGVNSLHSVEHSVIPDRIEAGTFLIAGAITKSEISIAPIFPDHLASTIAKLKAIGCSFVSDAPHTLRIIPAERLQATDIETLPYPGFPTDMQAQFTSLLSLCEGNSVVSETVFENRLRHAAELNRMGADIRVKGNLAIITGVPFLSGAPVMATDLRASAALVLAGLVARGKTTVMGLHHLDRGYDNIESKLSKLGANIKRVSPQNQLESIAR